jgi:phage gp36-like protein
MLSSYIRGPHRGSSDAPQRIDEYFVHVLHPLSHVLAVLQRLCAMCSAGMWYGL